MLLHIEIENVALIEKVNIDFHEGFNVLTGEAGAGKSVIIDSLNIILGNRFSRDVIRTGCDKAIIQAVFSVDYKENEESFEQLGIEIQDDDMLIITREVNQSGKSINRINSKIVTTTVIKKIGEILIDIHGQHDNQSLLRVENHIDFIDLFAGTELFKLNESYRQRLVKYKELKGKVKSLLKGDMDRDKKIDFLKFQIDEIENAELIAGEDEKLEADRVKIANSETILESLSNAYDNLFVGSKTGQSCSDMINKSIRELGSISKYNNVYSDFARDLEEITYQLDDIAEKIRTEKEQIDYDPEELYKIEARIDKIDNIKRKYGKTIDEVLKYYEIIKREIEELTTSGELIESLKVEIKETEKDLLIDCQKLSNLRKKTAKVLEKSIIEEMQYLEMKNTQFSVKIDYEDKSTDVEIPFTVNGLDKVEFLISPNLGEPLRPLVKIASGGEMARVMLAIKTILAKVDKVSTLVFDEIDTGISGKAAQKVGEKLYYISRSHQIICVTHLAQIAAMADQHFLIEKISYKNHTISKIRKLQHEERKSEVARIMGGDNVSDLTLKYAEEMINNSIQMRDM